VAHAAELQLCRDEISRARARENRASREELQSANEEPQSTNEELQSANEEPSASQGRDAVDERGAENGERRDAVQARRPGAGPERHEELAQQHRNRDVSLDQNLNVRRFTDRAAKIISCATATLAAR
jgi:hypothetical protein